MPIPLALYVHFPWCVTKCPYCDFNSHPLQNELPEQSYLDALISDLRNDAKLAGGRKISTVFLGGGTPSLFSPGAMQTLLMAVDTEIGLANDAEITMEANPGAIEHGDFAGYRAAGITRLSLGVQSFCDTHLAALGRVHNAAAARSAFAQARAAGFDNINLDLMYALPGQTVAEAVADVDVALELAPEHISQYHLTMEPGTRFGRTPPENLPDEDASWLMFEACQQRLSAGGYDRYEVSAYARDGRRCRHNLNYWQYGDYLGVGAGAHGKVTSADGAIRRYAKHAKPAKFQSAAGSSLSLQPLAMRAEINAENALFEFMLNNLRLLDGFSLEGFSERTGAAQTLLMPGVTAAIAKGLLVADGGNAWQPTELGLRFLDDLQGLFLPEA